MNSLPKKESWQTPLRVNVFLGTEHATPVSEVVKKPSSDWFSWKITSHKDHFEVCLPNSRLLSGLIRMWSSMKITLDIENEQKTNSEIFE